MFDTWKLQDFAPGEGLTVGAQGIAFDDAAWISVPAPGDVHRALIAAGRIPDPFYDRNEELCVWMEEREWWYRTTFDAPAEALAPGERVRLVFHGLDTFATVWLDGAELGRSQNMFRPTVFDVTGRLRPDATHTLALCFDRPLDHLDGRDIRGWNGEDLPRVAMRKAQFGYGWDWGPRLPTIGIWRPVELRRERRAILDGVHAYTLDVDHEAGQALIGVRVEAERFGDAGPLIARLRLRAPDTMGDAAAAEATIALDGDGARLTGLAYLQVEQARLWWTHDLGEPALYTVQVTLTAGQDTFDRHEARMGIRTLELDQSPDQDEPGTRFFRFVLNGVPTFAKGADWIPADSFVGAIPPERYTTLITDARDANMTMLRVWGGGIYEHDHFYDECDRLGLLVWQDFMFACSPYPEDAALAAEVAAEARYQVRRLRGHPSLALWCGNNENQWIHDQNNWERPDYPVPGALYYATVLPRVVAAEDGRTPYWAGSPYGGNDYNSAEDGDRHNWEVWHGLQPRRFGEPSRAEQTPAGVSYLHYAEDMGRFISEFGMHAAPVRETLRRVIPADQLYHHSASMDWHNKDNPKNKGDNLMETVTGLPRDLDEYVDFSMIAQAEGLKFGIEHYRRRTPHCAGTLVWQLNDCWPVLSWSVLDYYGFGKAGYYYLKRVYAPVLASFKALDEGGVELWITNDTRAAVQDSVTVTLGTFGGEALWEETREVVVDALTSRAVRRWSAHEAAAGPDRYLTARSSGRLFPDNRHFFAAIQDLRRVPVELAVDVAPVSDRELRVTVSAPVYAYFVHLVVPDEQARLSDNYFDLAPGQSRTVVVIHPERLTPNMVTVLSLTS